MVGDLDTGHLAGLPADQRAALERVNGPGLAALRSYLASGEAVAFLGAGASAPLYPLWAGLIGELVDAAAGRLTRAEAATCRALASTSPDAVVEIVRRSLGGRSVPRGAAAGAAGAVRPGDRAVVDGRAGAGVPVRVPRRGDHEL